MTTGVVIRTRIDRGERAQAHYVAQKLGVTVLDVYAAIIHIGFMATADMDDMAEQVAALLPMYGDDGDGE